MGANEPGLLKNNDYGMGWKRWQVYTTMLGLLALGVGTVWRAGGADASRELRLSRMEFDLQTMKADYARRDIVDQRLSTIEKTEDRIEKIEEDQANKLQELLLEERRNRR